MRGMRRRDDDRSDGTPGDWPPPRGGDGRGSDWANDGDWQAGETDRTGHARGGYGGAREDASYEGASYYDAGGYKTAIYNSTAYADAGQDNPGYDDAGYGSAGKAGVRGDYGGEFGTQYRQLRVPWEADNDGDEFSGATVSSPAQSGTPRPYGRLAIFTLLDDKEAEFDRLAEEAAEGVRTSEPDTLVYVIHVVPKAPMQRIIYEIYRNRAAFEEHERQPHTQRFVAERRSCVLATNIIDLRLKYAKVAALFQGDQAAQQAQHAPQSAPSPQSAPPPLQRRLPRAPLEETAIAPRFIAAESHASADGFGSGGYRTPEGGVAVGGGLRGGQYPSPGYGGGAGYGEAGSGWFGNEGNGQRDEPGASPAGSPPWQESPDWDPPSYARREQGGAR